VLEKSQTIGKLLHNTKT